MQGNNVRRQLPYSLLATAIVVVLPAFVVAMAPGPPGPLLGIPICIALSLGFARGADAVWRRSPRSREVLFADLMLWGWARRVATERRLAQAHNLVEDAGGDADLRVKALERVSAMLESRDAYTRRHSLRVTRYSEAIARGLDLPEAEVAYVREAAALHDVGKFFTPREVLNKPGRLTDEEFAIIRRHPGEGADLLHGVVEPEVEAMIRHHHERLGGAGYPDGLVGDAIPLGARIIAVADTFDAMTSTRTYRSARPHAKALTVLDEEAGVALDARAVAAFTAYYSGKRGTAWSSVASGLTQTLAPLRELLLPAARALPALGASAAITAPVLVGGGGAAAAAAGPVRDSAPRLARAAAAAGTSASPPRLTARLPTRRAERGARPAERRRSGAATERLTSTTRPGGSGPGARPVGGSRHPARTPDSTSRPGSQTGQGSPTTPGSQGGPTTPGSPSAPTSGSDGAGTPTTHTPPASSTPAPASTQAPASTPAPTSPPEVTTNEVTVGDVTVPGVEIDLPDLPIDVPQVQLPPLSLP